MNHSPNEPELDEVKEEKSLEIDSTQSISNDEENDDTIFDLDDVNNNYDYYILIVNDCSLQL